MKPLLFALAAASVAPPALAQDTRGMEAHVHGVSTARIAVDNGIIDIDILSPGADIVGFEYEATSAEDKDAVAAAIRQFLVPDEIVALPGEAGCRLTEVLSHLHAGDADHDDAHPEDDDHADHGDEADHDPDHDHAADDDDGDGDGDGDGATHSAFHVTYAFACDDAGALTSIAFPFFERFANAREIEVQYVTEAGAGTAELTPDATELTFE